MLSELSTLSALIPEQTTLQDVAESENNAIFQAAKDFEASYIAQMLTFSGMDKALTGGGGEDMSAFTSFYIESLADKIADNGGFGLAEKFYESLLKSSGANLGENLEDPHVELGKL